MHVNLFPALLLAGPPHAGKSVLAHELTTALKRRQIDFILLRTAPDGEGDWTFEAPYEVAFAVRKKGVFTPELVTRMERAVLQRQAPMLVDVGGKPRGDQFRVLRACTHYVLLYRTEAERAQWEGWLNEMSLLPVAVLRSDLKGEDAILREAGVLEGVIAGLDRKRPRLGRTFEALLNRLCGIFDYPSEIIREHHLSRAPEDADALVLEELARAVGVGKREGMDWWTPEAMRRALALIPRASERGLALYGRGPAWLYAAIAIHALARSRFYVFDARHYGWIAPPQVQLDSAQENAEFGVTPHMEGEALWLSFDIPNPALEPEPIHIPPLPPASVLVIDGPLPYWMLTAVARALAPRYMQVAIREMRRGRSACVVASGSQVGEVKRF
ncbi:MAG: hypothetical protein GXP42_08525 [Chloroflexi bacterium]|nr:hypothetical protein [Chloroflexota bacterium]